MTSLIGDCAKMPCDDITCEVDIVVIIILLWNIVFGCFVRGLDH